MTCQMQSPDCDGRALMYHYYMPCVILTLTEVQCRRAALCMQCEGCVAAALRYCANKLYDELLQPKPYQDM